MSEIVDAFLALPHDVALRLARDLSELQWDGPAGNTSLISIGAAVLTNLSPKAGQTPTDPEDPQQLYIDVLLGDACTAAERLNPDVEPYATVRRRLLEVHAEHAGDCMRCTCPKAAPAA